MLKLSFMFCIGNPTVKDLAILCKYTMGHGTALFAYHMLNSLSPNADACSDSLVYVYQTPEFTY